MTTRRNASNVEPLAVGVRTAAALMSVSPSTMYELIHRGEVPAIRLGDRLLVSRRALEEMLSRPAAAGGNAR